MFISKLSRKVPQRNSVFYKVEPVTTTVSLIRGLKYFVIVASIAFAITTCVRPTIDRTLQKRQLRKALGSMY